MTISVIIGGEHWAEFATNRGTGDFMRWVQTLEVEEFPLLAHFADHGWVNEVDKLPAEIKKAIGQSPPSASVRTILDGFISSLKSHSGSESVMLTNGTTDQETEGEWWIDGQPI